jgi:flagellin
MSITVNTNVSSINAQRHLAKSSKSLDTAMQRLSSGLRINSAADDAAGLAISTGITSQTNGLTQAERNANDGLSVVGTAEGALTTQTTILQRIRELAVQAANDINSGDNRASIQEEIDAQVSELTRLGNTTTFNGINLLNGTFTGKQLQVGAYSNQTISVTLGDFRAAAMGSIATTSGLAAAAGINQVGSVGAAAMALNVSLLAGGTQSVASGTTSDGVSTFNATNSAIAKATAVNQYTTTTGVTAKANATVYTGAVITSAATYTTLSTDSLKINGVEVMTSGVALLANDSSGALAARINMFSASTGVTAGYTGTGAATQLVMTAADGRNVDVVTAGTGLTAARTGLAGPASQSTAYGSLTFTSTKDFIVTGTGAGLGATQSNIGIDTNKKVSLIDVTTQSGASVAIDIIDSALKQVSTAEASLGALSNRLNNTISNIEIANENLSAANSRILDTDFAVETANMTRAQIIQQSSVAVLTQANSRPQIALTLLKG